MKPLLVALAALTLIGGATAAQAQDGTTVIHKQSSDGDSSKTVVKHDDGAKTVIKHHGNMTKKVHTDANGDKTVVKKTTEQ